MNNHMLRNVVGLDLGRQQDYSALALLQWRVYPAVKVDRSQPAAPPPKRAYAVPTLKRWPLQTPYLTIAQNVVKFLQTPALAETPCLLVVDATGVGGAVCEMLKEAIANAEVKGGMVSVTITAGSAVTLAGDGQWHVAKKQLVSVLQVLLGQRRLHVADLPEAKVLDRELRTFTVKVSESANESFESWRERDHDDLVLAVALAAWAAETLPHPANKPAAAPPVRLMA